MSWRWRRNKALSLLRCLLAFAAIALVLGGCGREPERPDALPDSSAPADPTAPDSLAPSAAPVPAVNPFAEPARRALRIELGLDAYRTVDGTWAAGDASSTFTAYFAGDTLRFIEERLSAGEYGSESNVYYFAESGAGPALFYAVQDAVQVRPEPDGAARRDTVRLRVALTPEGGLLATEGTVNGEPEPVDRVLVDGVRQHAEALRERAQERVPPTL